MGELEVRQAEPQAPPVRALIDELDRYQLSLYPVESNHLDSLEELTADNVYFVGAYENGEVLGCGAIKFLPGNPGYGEIKRVIVRTDARGRGISRQVMAALEARARQQGVNVIRLETGIYQPEAISLYVRLGYVKRGPFGDYTEDPLSVFMEKRLDVA